MAKVNWRVELQEALDNGLAKIDLRRAEAELVLKQRQASLVEQERRITERMAHLDRELATVERVAIQTTNAVYQATEGIIAQYALDKAELERQEKESENGA